MVGEKVDGKILFGARSEKPQILFGARGNNFWYQMTVTKILYGSPRVDTFLYVVHVIFSLGVSNLSELILEYDIYCLDRVYFSVGYLLFGAGFLYVHIYKIQENILTSSVNLLSDFTFALFK